jgi:hypothetical protein
MQIKIRFRTNITTHKGDKINAMDIMVKSSIEERFTEKQIKGACISAIKDEESIFIEKEQIIIKGNIISIYYYDDDSDAFNNFSNQEAVDKLSMNMQLLLEDSIIFTTERSGVDLLMSIKYCERRYIHMLIKVLNKYDITIAQIISVLKGCVPDADIIDTLSTADSSGKPYHKLLITSSDMRTFRHNTYKQLSMQFINKIVADHNDAIYADIIDLIIDDNTDNTDDIGDVGDVGVNTVDDALLIPPPTKRERDGVDIDDAQLMPPPTKQRGGDVNIGNTDFD